MDSGKQQTILELAYRVETGLNALECERDRILQFGMVKEEEKKGSVARNSNAIGEIIDSLNRSNKKLDELTLSISTGIFNKLVS